MMYVQALLPILMRATALAGLVVALMACGAPGSTQPPQNGDGNGPDVETLEQSLNALGVDTSPTDRVDPQGDPLPDTYAPLGGTAAFSAPEAFAGPTGTARTDELFVIGSELTATASRISLVEIEGAVIDGGGGVDPGTVATLHTLNEAEEPWLADGSGGGAQSNEGRSLRAAAAGDLTGDGLEETVIVYVDTTVADRTVRVLSIGHAESGFVRHESTIAIGTGVLDVKVVTGDFDGDGTASVVVALGDESGIDLLFLDGGPGSFTVDGSATKRLPATPDVDQITVRMAVGDLDYDTPQELVVVVNEQFDVSGDLSGTSRYFVYDDATTGFAELKKGNVTADVSGLQVARVADVAVGDVTGNGLDEIVLGGLLSFNTTCNDQPDALVTVLASAIGGFEQVAATVVDAGFPDCPALGPWRHRFFHVTTPDLDGDGVKAIQAGRYVFAGFHETRFTVIEHLLPTEVFFASNSDAGAYVTTNTSAVVAADLTGDGRDNIATYHQWRQDVRVWGVSAIDTVGFAELSTIATSSYNIQANVRPLLVPVNVDHDSAVLSYGAGTHRLVFTEPLLIAVTAAAPCGEGIGQNLSGCSVTFGNSATTTVTSEYTVSVSASTYVGVKLGGAGLPFIGEMATDIKAKVGTTAARSTSDAYFTTTSRRFTSGPLEDAIVFSTIPYDRYEYAILSHPDPDLIGGRVEVMIPREPIVVKVEREFYNARLSESSTPIGADVFDHTVGDLGTYPSAARKNALMMEYGGLEHGPLSVGEGTGSTGLSIEVGTEVGEGRSLALEAEFSADVTIGPGLGGFTIGSTSESNVTVSSGESTTYDVSVGDLSSETFDDHSYSFGLFTYVQPIGGQAAEVINFWVQ